jgi:hypothetical protein
LTLHWTNSCVHEEEPVVHFVPLTSTLGETDLVVRVVAIHEVLHDATGFEEVDSLAVSKGVGECWDTAIGIDSTEPGLLLGVFADVDFVDLVLDTKGDKSVNGPLMVVARKR